MSYGELEAGLVRENNDLQARLAQCEGERDNLKQSFEALAEGTSNLMDEKLTIKKERDAALERVTTLQAAVKAYVDAKVQFMAQRDDVKAIPDWEQRTNEWAAIECPLIQAEAALLALRAGSVTNGGSAQQIRREVGS